MFKKDFHRFFGVFLHSDFFFSKIRLYQINYIIFVYL